ncbi:alpha/beta hydrolase [Arthrobacter sp. zg-Y40]|uniref:alpha/beta hydrolase n=1 Tax=Arthrobacter sp. zg-Y40 TaxID=2886939 RepID=UPI001D152199|nr:alpha/beta hydrolase [Arthrobacter sp. zg-Y40]MCC3279921.1 alpha/beta hydrolase [Arthrobacter sp. zg-Y40]
MQVHPQAQAFLDLLKDAPPLDTQTAEQNRADLENALPLTGAAVDLFSVQDRTIAGVPVRVYSPDAPNGTLPGAVVYFHGGGWVLGDLEIADTTARALARHSGAVVVSVDYRKAPEHVFPAAADDAEAVTLALLSGESGLAIDPNRVAVAGDSAGGNLAAVTAQQLAGHMPPLAHQVLVYPVTDARVGSTASYAEFADGHFLTRRDMQYFVDTYAGGADLKDIRLSPARNPDLSGVAPATVITGECDPLRDEGEAYARQLREAGVPTTAVRFGGQVHPFLYMAGLIDDAGAAREFIGARLRQALAADAVLPG